MGSHSRAEDSAFMRIALISDVHGNTVALDAVLADMNQQRPEVVVCLGDIVAGGPDPGGAVDRVAENALRRSSRERAGRDGPHPGVVA